MKFLKTNYKGLLLCLAIAVPAWILGKLFPVIGGAIIAIVAGAGATGTGVGAAPGIGAIALGSLAYVHGGDQIQAGLKTLFTGESVDSYTSQGLQNLGMSQTAANLTDAGISIVLTAGAGSVTKTANAATSAAGKTAQESFFDGTSYTTKVKGQMKKGDFHAFPEEVTAFENDGTISKIVGKDGIERDMLEIPGSYRSKDGVFQDGVFQFIKEPDGTINHRFFVPKN